MGTGALRDPAPALQCQFGTIETQNRAHALREPHRAALLHHTNRLDPDDAVTVWFSSGPGGEPKGIVPPPAVLWAHMQRGAVSGYAPGAVALLSAPVDATAALVSVFPALAMGVGVEVVPKRASSA